MKQSPFLYFIVTLILASCASTPTITVPATPVPTTAIPPSKTPRNLMLPTWTPLSTSFRRATTTPRSTSTPFVTQATASGHLTTAIPTDISIELLLDRPTYSLLPKPLNLVTMQYDPGTWSINSFYPTSYMGYSLTHHSIYDCKLEPSVGRGAEGYQVEQYTRALGVTTFEIARVSQSGILAYANYCTGEGEDYTCYQVTPGSDHAACTQAAEDVLATYKLITNPFFSAPDISPNHWLCQDEGGVKGLCQISYSVPLNALVFTQDGQAWVGGDDGVLFHFDGQSWSETTSPTSHPIYDLSFFNPSEGWAVGDGAQVIHWDGTAWSEVLPYHAPGEGPAGSTQVLYAVDAYSTDDVWMVGAITGIDGKTNPYALHWNGESMIEESDFPDCNCGLNAVLILGEDKVISVGGSDLGAIAFQWDGAAWMSTLVPGADALYALTQSVDGMVWAAGIEKARDLSDTRGSLYRWDGSAWQRIALPPLTGGIYALSVQSLERIILGGDFTALRTGLDWQPIITDIAGYGWIVDIEVDPQGITWALARSGNLFRLEIKPK